MTNANTEFDMHPEEPTGAVFRHAVLLFAHLREAHGSTVWVELPTGATVADLRHRLPFDTSRCRISVNLMFADDADAIPVGAEVAVIPPVSGG